VDELLSVETVGLDQHRAHIRVAGELDLSTSAPLWAVLHSHLAAGRKYLRLDLSGVEFVDAAALGGIAVAHHDALTLRGTLVLTGVHTRIARLLSLTGLDDVLFIGGPRSGGEFDSDAPISDGAERPQPRFFPARPVTWTPPAAARRSRPTRPDQ
jgi:anti-sigma B factor antagonist